MAKKKITAATKQQPVIAMEAEVKILAAENDESGKPKGPPKFDVVAYTGGAMSISGYDLPLVVDLAGLSFGNSLIANLDHDPKQRVGHVTEKSKSDGELKLGGMVSAATSAAKEVVESAANGFIWQASIEAIPIKLVEVESEKKVTVNGREFSGPIYVARKSTLKGFAFVSHGADDNTTANISAAAESTKEKKMDKELQAFIEAMLPGVEIDSLSAEAVGNLKADFEGKQGTRTKKKTDLTAGIEAKKAEKERIDSISEIALNACDSRPYDIEAIKNLAEQAIEGKWAVDKFRLELLEASIPPAGTVFTPKSRDQRLSSRVLEAAICQAGNLPNIDDKFDDQTLQAAHDRFPHGVGLKQAICLCAESHGVRSQGGEVTPAILAAACGMTVDKRPIHAGQAFSTVTLTNLLANTANKFLLQGWMGVEQVWRSIASRSSPRDFKQYSNISLTGALQYEKVGPAGEIKHGTLSDLAYTQQVETYALMIALTREMIINDDLNSLTAVPARLGRGGALKVNDVFWTVFLNNSSFFTSGNANVSTGAGSALGTADGAAINAAEVKFMNQTDPDGKPLGVMPKIMLVPPTLANTAARWMGGQLMLSTGNTDAALSNANVFAGRYRVYSSAYMENSSYTGYSTAAWYLLADPNDIPVIDVGFLNGRDTPTVDTSETDFNTLGMQWRGVIDFGVALQEYRGGVRSAGS
jgi:hypothetical protein